MPNDMPVTHVAHVFLAGRSKDDTLIKSLQEKNLVLNQERLKKESRYNTNLFDNKQIDFIQIDAASSPLVDQKNAVVYFFDVTTALLDHQIEQAQSITARFEKKLTFVIVQTKNIIPDTLEHQQIKKLQQNLKLQNVYSSKSQQDLTKLKQKLLDLSTKIGNPSLINDRVPSLEISGLEEPSNVSDMLASQRSLSPNTVTSNFEQTNDPWLSNGELSSVKNSMVVLISSWIENFRKKYDTEINKNSTGIHAMLRQMDEIQQENTNPAAKIQNINMMMKEIANKRLYGWCGLRTFFWSNSSFFGKGRSTQANTLYKICSETELTTDNLITLGSS